jgi:hypothetical protein
MVASQGHVIAVFPSFVPKVNNAGSVNGPVALDNSVRHTVPSHLSALLFYGGH